MPKAVRIKFKMRQQVSPRDRRYRRELFILSLEQDLQSERLMLLRNIGVTVLSLSLVLNMFFQTSFSVMADLLMSDFSATAIQLASLGSVFFYVYSLMQIPSGVLADAFGPHLVVSSGLMVAGVGALFFACSYQVVTAYLGRALIGLGMSLIYISTLRYVANWWPPNRYSSVNGSLLLLVTWAQSLRLYRWPGW